MNRAFVLLRWLSLAGATMGVAGGSSMALAQGSCQPVWTVGLSHQGTNAQIRAMAVFDDGTGPALYAAGEFTQAGTAAASRIAKWNGSTWSALGGGLDGTVWALCGFDDGSGPALYAGGDFTTAGGVAASHLARWKNGAWSAVGGGLNGSVFALTVFDAALHVGGAFNLAGTTSANRVARWNGSAWSALGPGLSGGVPLAVRTLAVFDSGGGPALYAGGGFHTAGSTTVNHVARWDGTAWSALGTGVGNVVNTLCAFDDGSGPALYAGGMFVTAGVVQVNHVARWNGVAWSSLAEGLDDDVNAMAVFDAGDGPMLCLGGYFAGTGAAESRRVIRWNGAWQVFASGIGDDDSNPCWCDPSCSIACGPKPGYVNALAVVGDALYAGGSFVSVAGGCVPASNIARWACPPATRVRADFDWDGDVDLVDFGHFQACFNGPNRPYAQRCCEDADFDADRDVDLVDFGTFQQCFNGPNRPPYCLP